MIKERNTTNSEEDITLFPLERQISDILAKEGREKVLKFRKFSAQNGSVNENEMWKHKKKLWPKVRETIPTGKLNHQGRLVTGSQDIKNLLAKEYSEKLRLRPIHTDLKDIDMLKKESFKVKLEEATKCKRPPWNTHDLDVFSIILVKISLEILMG